MKILLVEQSENFEWAVLNENDACGMCYTRNYWLT